MTMNSNTHDTNKLKMLTTKLPLVFIIIAVTASCLILATAPTPAKIPNTQAAINVNVMQVDAAPYTPNYTAYGTVIAKNTITLTAQVEGRLDFLAQNMIEGGILNLNDAVFQQDRDDLIAIQAQREAEVEIAKAQLALELGEQRIAANDYQMMKQDFDEKEWQINLELLLRKPQLAQAKATLNIAQNALKIAQRDLQRSRWTSDKRYLVHTRLVAQGDYLAKGDKIAKLIDMNELRVPVYLPRKVASQVMPGQHISLYQPDTQRTITARVSHVFPAIDNNIHLQKVYAEYKVDVNDTPTLIIGDFVEATLALTSIQNTLTVPLSAIDNGLIWLVSANNTLIEKPATVLFQDKVNAVIVNVIAHNEQLIINKMHSPQANLTVNIVEAI